MAYAKRLTTKKNGFDFTRLETFPWIPVSVFLLAVYYFGKQIADFIRGLIPDPDYTKAVTDPINVKVKAAQALQTVDSKGYFLAPNGARYAKRYTVTQAKQQAEEMSAILKTGKENGFWASLWAYSWSADKKRINAICNPNYPTVYRRFVVESYRDIFTSKRSMQNDVKTYFDNLVTWGGVIGTGWTNEHSKYFTV